MINIKGIVQNNWSTGELLKTLKNSNVQYKTLSKDEERSLIEKFVAEGREDELRKLLVMHNIRLVFSIAKKYCKFTRDFDNMMAKGFYGLVYAANKFNLFEPVMIKVKTGEKPILDDGGNPIMDENTGLPKVESIYSKIPKVDPKTGKPEYVKFCTFASNWVFKYVYDEFGKKSILVDNNSISINDEVRIKNTVNNNVTMENYLDRMLSIDYRKPKTIMENLSENDVTDFYSIIGKYVSETNELTAIEKKIIIDTYYRNRKIREVAEDLDENPQHIVKYKSEALGKIKKYLSNRFNVKAISDLKA